MTIAVEGSGALADLIPRGLVLEDVRTVAEVFARLNLPSHEGIVILVNERLADWSTELRAGDRVHFVPVIAGG